MARKLSYFRGEHRQKIDSKGRVSIPALYRRVLEGGDPDWADGLRPQLVIVYGHTRGRYLECFTVKSVEEVDASIARMSRGSEKRVILERVFHAQSHPTETDNDGRLVLPQKLRDIIGLEDEAYFIASGDTFQIWKPETYDRDEVARTEAWLDKYPDSFNPLSLADSPQKEG